MPSKKELQEQIEELGKKIWKLIRLTFDIRDIKHTEGFKKK